MNARRLTVALGATLALLVGSAGLAGAGVQIPRDMLATPGTGPIGQVVVITNAANSPCGAGPNDGPVEIQMDVIKPDSTDLFVTVPVDDNGNWTYSYTDTDQVGTYTVEATCADTQQVPQQTAATDFDYTDTTFDITAAVTTTTTASTTTTTPTAPPAVAATSTPAFTG